MVDIVEVDGAAGRPNGVDDPYGGPISAYELMYQDLVKIVDGGLERIITLAEENAAARITSP
jgi:hypothetical protein